MKESYTERCSESRWPRAMRWRSVRAQRSVGQGCTQAGYGAPKYACLGCRRGQSRRKAAPLVALYASRQRAPRGLRTWHACDLSMFENREVPRSPACGDGRAGRAGNTKVVIP